MPYSYDPNLEDPDSTNNGAEKTEVAGGSQVAGGASQTAPGGSASPSSAGGGQTHSDTFQNLNDYLNANQGSGFGQQFAGKVQGEVDNANKAQSDSAQEFKNASDQGTVNYNSDLVNQATSDPTNFVTNQDNVNAFTKMRDANYAGPTTYADDADAYQKASSATQKAQDYTTAAQNEAGRFALLDNYFGNSDYNQGQKSLDNLLISGDQGAGQALQQSSQAANQAQQNLQQQGTDLANYAAANRATTEATKNQIADAFTGTNGAIPTFQNQLTTNYQNDLANQTSDYNRLSTELNMGQISDADLARLGINLKTGDSLYNVDPSKFLSQNIAPTQDSTISAADYAKLNALDQLMGTTNTFVGDPTQIGTYNPNQDLNFDTTGFQNAVNAGSAAYQNALQGKMTQGGRTGGTIQDEINYDKNTIQPELAQWKGQQASFLPADQAYHDSLQQLVQQLQQQYGYNDKLNQQKLLDIPQPSGGRVIHLPS